MYLSAIVFVECMVHRDSITKCIFIYLFKLIFFNAYSHTNHRREKKEYVTQLCYIMELKQSNGRHQHPLVQRVALP